MKADDDDLSTGWLDLLVTAVCPVLVMGLVGSVAFFSLDVLYGGEYEGRLRWTLFFFVVGSVLVARISIQLQPGAAGGYGLALGAAAFLAMNKFVESGSAWGWLANIVILGIVAWTANKLTWDCTFLDETDPDPGAGSLGGALPALEGPKASVQRYQQRRKRERGRSSPPGRWVVLVSLVALPAFGLLQSLIPASDSGRRLYSLVLMSLYVGCAMGLLLCTSFLALRRYLRQRRLTMPAPLAGRWLTIGVGLIVGVLLLATFLPRPQAELPLMAFTPVGSKPQDASRFAPSTRERGEGKSGSESRGEGKGESEGQGKGQPGGKAGATSKAGEGKGSGGNGKASGQGKGQGKQGQSSDSNANGQGKGEGKQGQGKDANAKGERGNERGDPESDSPPPPPPELGGAVTALLNAIKWLVFAVLAVAFVLFVLWLVARHLAPAMAWAQRLLATLEGWWARLFGGGNGSDAGEATVRRRPDRPFAAFSNPFDTELGERDPVEVLARYSFAALEAWCRERGTPRKDDETAIEFARRVGDEVPALEKPVETLGRMVGRVVYGDGRLPGAGREHLREFWLTLERLPIRRPREEAVAPA